MKRIFVLAGLIVALSALSATLARAQAIPEQAYISGIVGHAQLYSLSCESRSAADWAAYWGVDIDETEFLNALPRSDNPNEGFVGDPNDVWGYTPPSSYGVHADPVAELLRSYGLDAHADTGLGWDEVRAEVAEGRPVIVWVIGSIWAGEAREYETEDGENVTVANNEHTMIVIGYDANRVHLVDALTGYTITHSIENFLASWSVLGNMAIIGEGSGELPASEVDSELSGETYIVQPGDTLNKVASRFDLYWPDLAALNDIAYPYILYPGQVLLLGGDGAQVEESEVQEEESIYTVQPDDDLMSIARELGLDWVTLARFNEILPPLVVSPGLRLNIPQVGEDTGFEVPETFTATATVSIVDLADFFGLDWIELAARNGIGFPYLLAPGQTIGLQ